ncbi:translation initiation factor IF-2 N-terminal domain-containing protein [Corynebacterium guangdongense]|uniref:Ribonuclease E n=1 Tax=Corynebacterium guangdongense TaxID=1783348 RepID=A0ABU1ZYW7_9CORY|nr:translation initiation factor IF-2 N-terminal domain-containing protein [Corynebacterium guangdongense]MDR7330040.1 ribonuclease E [Corynebacterium guangdongense]
MNSEETTSPATENGNSGTVGEEKSGERRAARRSTRKSTAKKTAAKKTTAKKSAAKATAEKSPAGKRATTKRATTKRAATKSAKKSPENTTDTNSSAAQETTGPKAATPQAAEVTTLIDRAALGERQRVYSLAKKIGISSKDLIVALDAVGLVKVAQSSLSLDEMNRVLDHLERKSAPMAPAPEPAAPEAPEQEAPVEAPVEEQNAPADESEERIRTRVRKNVANEIHQIEEKVEADLAAVVGEPESVGEAEARDDSAAEAGANAKDDAEGDTEHLAEGDAHGGVQGDAGEEWGDAVEDVLPEIVPAPTEAPTTAAYAPIFVVPRAGDDDTDADAGEDGEARGGRRRRSARRTTRRSSVGKAEAITPEAVTSEAVTLQVEPDTDHEETAEDLPAEPVALKGSTRLEAQKRRRTEMREAGRKKAPIVSQAEFLARRESVKRTMVVRERQHVEDPTNPALITQVAVLEDDLLVEHFVTSEAQASMTGNIYLGRVQNVLPSMEAAFIDIGKGRNGVLYSSEVDWKSAGLKGRNRKIEQALKSGDQVLVQVSKDPLGHKGARLTTQISLAGRYLVYVPGGRSAGISRKLPAPERKRLKDILGRVIPGEGGAIIRTAAENVPEEAIAADVNRLHTLWEDLQDRAAGEKASKGAKPVTLYEEPDMLVKVVRDLFNEDFTSLVVDGRRAWNTIRSYVDSVAPDLSDRLERYDRRDHDGHDAFARHRIDEQLQKALGRKVWLPSGGSLVIDRTEAMTVIDVNTGKFTGSGGNLEETVTRNNLEAAEEIVRQMRLRDLGGMIVVDFIDMVLPENQDLVLRRLKEALGRDRTRHQVSEVTSLGLVQMTRKRLGTGLLETFSTTCEVCDGRGLILHEDPVDPNEAEEAKAYSRKHKHNLTKGHAEPAPRREEPAPQPSRPSETDFEELAAAVIREEEPTAETREDTHQEEPAAEGRRSRRRGGRGRSRGRGGRPEQEQRQEERPTTTVDEVAAIAAAATERADEAEPEETAAVTGTQSYEQAVAEFEASPRRRRRTRGNSRSDHRPQREDFAVATKPDSPESAEDREQNAKVESAQRAEPKPPRASSGRRRSGRAQEASQRKTAKEDAVQAKTGEVKTVEVKTGKQEAPRVEAGTKNREEATGTRRGRRRAVRRLSPEQPAQRPEPQPEAAASASRRPETPAADQPASASGRRRRRATRRSGA